MSTLRNIVILGFVLAVAPVFIGSKAQQSVAIQPGDKLLTNEQMKKLFVGNSFAGQSKNNYYYTIFYPTYGKVLGELSSGTSDEGVWYVKNNKYCMTWNNWRDNSETCFQVYKKGSQILKLQPDGSILVQTLKPGNPENLY